MSPSQLESKEKELNHVTLVERSYIGYYLQGSLAPLFKVFKEKMTLPQAVERFKKHCQVMQYKFVRVRPWEVNLDHQEKLKSQDDRYTEDTDPTYTS